MKDFKLITSDSEVTFQFPTSFNEISASYLTQITEHIQIADNYTLIGIVYHETLGSIIISRKQAKKGFTSGVIPIFIKSGNYSANCFLKNAKVKDRLIIPSSSLQVAHHVVAPSNTLSIDCFIKFLDKDSFIAQRYHNNYGSEQCFFVEFKLIPNCDIVGFYNNNPKLKNNEYFTITPISESDDEVEGDTSKDSNK
ncbi:MAG: hypothetical protein J6Y28_09590 [Acholeplasmatales bacterium]|nr:hypothetical protein [Methanobrevibacter sp.]MBP5446410.1 hypothetical protein [Acholeplasmatales bacterium]